MLLCAGQSVNLCCCTQDFHESYAAVWCYTAVCVVKLHSCVKAICKVVLLICCVQHSKVVLLMGSVQHSQ